MLPEEAILQKALSGVLEGFGKNHAMIYWTLINNLHKPARQIKEETKLAPNLVYQILKDLIQKKLVSHTNTYPRLYYCRPTLETFDLLVKQYRSASKEELQNIRSELKKLVQNATAQSGEEYLIKINGGQTQLFNNKTKETIEYKHEIEELKQKLDKIPAKTKEKAWMTQR